MDKKIEVAFTYDFTNKNYKEALSNFNKQYLKFLENIYDFRKEQVMKILENPEQVDPKQMLKILDSTLEPIFLNNYLIWFTAINTVLFESTPEIKDELEKMLQTIMDKHLKVMQERAKNAK